MAQLTRREAYLRMLHGISIELSPSNVRSIVFLTDLASQELPQSGEGHRSGLEVLQLLWRRGHFSETRLQPLEGLLKEIVRNDLLGKHLEEFKEKYPATTTKEAAPFKDFGDKSSWQIISRSSSSFFPTGGHSSPQRHQKRAKSSSVCIMTSSASTTTDTGENCAQDACIEEEDVRLSGAEFRELLMHAKVKEASLSRSLQEKIIQYSGSSALHSSQQNPSCKSNCKRRSLSNSDSSSVASSYSGDKRSSTSSDVGYSSSGPHESYDTVSHDPVLVASVPVVASHDLKKESHDQSMESQDTGSSHGQPIHPHPPQLGWTLSWKLKRANFLPIIDNKKSSKFFDKKIKITVGKGSTKSDIDVLLKLFPYGGDGSTSCSIQVEVTRISKQSLPCAYLVLAISGCDTKDSNMIVSRHAECPLTQKKFVISEFLSHEIVKCSTGTLFDFRVTVGVKYSVCSDWVYVNTIQTDA